MVRGRQGIPGRDEASLPRDAIVTSRPQRQGSERSDKNRRTALDAAFGSQSRGVLESVLDSADAVIGGNWPTAAYPLRLTYAGARRTV